MGRMLMDYVLPEIKHGYVIYDPVTGLYSKGGTWNVWRKKPKVWSNIGFLKNHLHMFTDPYYNKDRTYKGHEEIHDIVTKEKLCTVDEMLNELRKTVEIRQEKWRAKHQKFYIESAQKELDKAKERLAKLQTE